MEKDIPSILEKFFKGECTLEEKLVLEEWYYSLGVDDHLKEALNTSQLEQLENMVLVRINSAIDQFENVSAPQKIVSKIGIMRKLIYATCGTAAMLALASYFYPSVLNGIKGSNTGQEQVAGMANYLNNESVIKKIVLVDGSTVWLSPKGKLKVLNNFDRNTRELFLDGLAFFKVTKNVNHPFIVRTSTVITKVWGTSFSVNAFSAAPEAKVSVLTGKVSVSVEKNRASDQSAEVMLGPEEQAQYTGASQKLLSLKEAYSHDLDIWRTFNLSFDNIKMFEVIRQLSEKFHINITVKDSKINDYLLIADFKGQNLPTILEVLKASMNISYKIDGDRLVLMVNKK